MLCHVRLIPGTEQNFYHHRFFEGKDIRCLNVPPQWHYQTGVHDQNISNQFDEPRLELKILWRQTRIIPPPIACHTLKKVDAGTCAVCILLCNEWSGHPLQRSLHGFSLIVDSVLLYILFVFLRILLNVVLDTRSALWIIQVIITSKLRCWFKVSGQTQIVSNPLKNLHNTYSKCSIDIIRVTDSCFDASRPAIKHLKWKNRRWGIKGLLQGNCGFQNKGYVNSACLKRLLILCSCETSTDSFNNSRAQCLDVIWSTGKTINTFSSPFAHGCVMPVLISSVLHPT